MDNAYELVTGDGLNNGYLYFVEPLRRLLSHCGENGDVYVLSHGSEIDLCLIVIDDRAEGCEGEDGCGNGCGGKPIRRNEMAKTKIKKDKSPVITIEGETVMTYERPSYLLE